MGGGEVYVFNLWRSVGCPRTEPPTRHLPPHPMQYLLQIRSHGGLRLFRGKVIEEKRVASHWRLFFIRSRAADECISSPLCGCVVVWVYFFFSFSRCCFFCCMSYSICFSVHHQFQSKAGREFKFIYTPFFQGGYVCVPILHTQGLLVCVCMRVCMCVCVCAPACSTGC